MEEEKVKRERAKKEGEEREKIGLSQKRHSSSSYDKNDHHCSVNRLIV